MNQTTDPAALPENGSANSRKSTFNSVNIVRYIAVLAAAVIFAVYAFGHENEYSWYEFIPALLALALFTGIFIAAVPRLISLLSGGDLIVPTAVRRGVRFRNFLLIAFGALALHLLTYIVGAALFSVNNGEGDLMTRIAQNWSSAWMKPNTDAQHYINIAENWYRADGDERLLLVFFPMFPLCIRAFNIVFRDSYVSAFVINSIAAALASGMTYLTLLPVLGSKRSKAAAFIALLLPGAIFFNSPMTEPLFLLFSLCGFFFMQKRNYIAAGLFTALAGFTRSLGVLLAVPIALVGIGHIVGLVREKKPAGRTAALLIAGLFISILGTLGYLAINWSLHGDPLKFLEFQRDNWYQQACPFFDTPRYMINYLLLLIKDKPDNVISLWIPGLIAVFGSLALMLCKARKLPASYTVYFLCYFAVSIGCTWLLSSVRYLCAAVPLIAAIADSCDKRWKTAVIMLCLVPVYIVYVSMYMRWMAIY